MRQWCRGWWAGCDRQPRCNAAGGGGWREARGWSCLSVFPAVEHVAAAVLRPAPFAMLGAARLFLPEADPVHLGLGRAPQHEHALDAFGSALPARAIVFSGAALVAVALYPPLLSAGVRA